MSRETDLMTVDRRGVSPVFGYALTLGIGMLLMVGLVMAAGGHVDSQREQVTESELQVIGGHVAADIAAADRLHRTAGTTEIQISRDLTYRVVGSTYRIEVKNNSQTAFDGPTDHYLELTAREGNLNVSVVVGVPSQTRVAETSVGGGPIVVEARGNELVVRNA